MGKKSTFGFFLENNNNGALVIEDLKDITLGELAEGYKDNSDNVEGGVYGWGGKLEIRPKFQRAFVVDGDINWQSSLIHSVLNKRPIGVMYFGNAGENKFINIDGQQRLMTLLSFINNELTLKMKDNNNRIVSVNFSMLDDNYKRIIKQYTPSIKICYGNEKSILEWFKTINQPISELTEQELRNAAYNGEWCESVKRKFSIVKKTSKPNKDNYDFLSQDGDYYFGNYSLHLQPERQDVLEMALDWASLQTQPNVTDKSLRIELYMSMFSSTENNDNGNDLVTRYKAVIDWVKKMFRSEFLEQKCAKNVDWGRLYVTYKDNEYDLEDLNNKVENLFNDVDVTANSKVFEYVLMGCPIDKKGMLVLRAFNAVDKMTMYKKQGGMCPITKQKHDIKDMVAHHIVAWECGGKTDISNGVMIYKDVHQKDIHAECKYTPEQIKTMRDELIESVSNKTNS